MGEEKDIKKELEKELRRKRIRKYGFMGLAVVILCAVVIGIKIEGKDALLADGQGNVVTYNQGSEQERTDQTTSTELSKEDHDNQDKKDNQEEHNESTDNSKDNSSKDTRKDQGKKTGKTTTPKDAAVDNQKDPTASNGGNESLKPEEPEPVTVTIEIRCDTLAEDKSKLENPAIEEYIPDDGVILPKTTYQGTTENTVFDVLNTVCRNYDIQLEFSYTPLFASYYIEGIHYLYEFDGGKLSGWMFKVNDWFPNYGCSSYYLNDGDEIVWLYTCNGGADVGGSLGA